MKSHVEVLDERFARELRKAGFDTLRIAALQRTSPLAALRARPLQDYWRTLEAAGRELAQMNVTPTDISAALRVCDALLDEIEGVADFAPVREELRFATILRLNQAYHDVREAENRAFYRLLQIEAEALSTDVLLRRLLEEVAESVKAAAAHAFLLTAAGTGWEVRASTAKAASSRTEAWVNAPSSLKRGLEKAKRLDKPGLILDPGWRKRYALVWSIPVRGTGVLQFAFPAGRELLPREIELLSVVGERCHAAIARTRRLEHITQREEQLSKLAIRMLMVEENERRRISRELHDDPGQSLVVIRLQMELIEQLLPQNSEARERLAEARDITEKTILVIRRLISDLSPAVLDQLGLGAAMRQLVNRFRGRYPSQVNLEVGQLPQLDSNFELVIYRLAQECLNNISRHSGATAVNISVSVADRVLRLHVQDNGTGFDVEQALERTDCFGLKGIRERVAVLGGSVDLISTRKEGQSARKRNKAGSVVRIELPIP